MGGCEERGEIQSTTYTTDLYQNEVPAPTQKGGKNIKGKGLVGCMGKGLSYMMTAVLSVKYKARSPTLHVKRKG